MRNIDLCVKAKLINQYVLHFYHAAEFSIASETESDRSTEKLEILAQESDTELKALASQFNFEKELNEVLNYQYPYIYSTYKDSDVFEFIFLKDLSLQWQHQFLLMNPNQELPQYK